MTCADKIGGRLAYVNEVTTSILLVLTRDILGGKLFIRMFVVLRFLILNIRWLANTLPKMSRI